MQGVQESLLDLANNAVRVTLLPSTWDYSYTNLSVSGTTTIKSGAGVLHSVTINTKGGSGTTLTLYDNTSASGTKIATVDVTAGPLTLTYDAAFSTGLTVVASAGTPEPNVTLTWL